MNPHSHPLQEKLLARKMQSMQICSMKAKWGLPTLTGTKQNEVFCVSFLFLASELKTITIFLLLLTENSLLRVHSGMDLQGNQTPGFYRK